MNTTEPPSVNLPLEALVHPGSTAVGLLDLGAPPRIVLNASDDADYVDQLVLVRLHGKPLGLIWVQAPPTTETAGQLTETIWNSCRERILLHLSRCGCHAAPTGPGDLLAGLPADDCPELTPRRPEGRAAVVIPTVGRLHPLERILHSLVRMSCEDFEVIVVDNRPSDSTRELVTRMAGLGPIRYLAEPRPSASIARNSGASAAAAASFIAFTDDDVIVDRTWLSRLLAPFHDERVDAVTGMVLPWELATPAQKRYELYHGLEKRMDQVRYDLTEHRADRLLYPYWGNIFGWGNSMAFRRTALLAAGGFDPALGAGTPSGGGEDGALLTGIILNGGQIVHEPQSLCWHQHRRDDDALDHQMYAYGVGFTASLWKYATHDPGFMLSALRSVPLLLRILSRRRGQRQEGSLPIDPTRAEFRGRFLGPYRYEQSRRLARRLGAKPLSPDDGGRAHSSGHRPA